MLTRLTTVLAIALAAAGSPAFAQFVEIEPNDAKPSATPVTCLSPGGTVHGTSTGILTSGGLDSVDTYLVEVCPAPPGIYRHDLTITTGGVAGHTGTLLGVWQNGTPSETAFVQTSSAASTPPRFNRWFGFGHGERLYYRVSGAAITTAPYVATHTVTPVTPVLVTPDVQSGFVTLTTAGRTAVDTEMFLFDSNMQLLRWNDDDPNLITTQSRIEVNLAPGTYFLAVSTFNTAIAQANGPLPPNPPDNADRSTTGNRLDFPDALVRTSFSSASQDLDFGITDSLTTRNVTAGVAAAYDIYWATFRVTPAPQPCCFATGSCALQPAPACLGAGGLPVSGANCSGACPAAEACCSGGGECQFVSPLFCAGMPQGPGSTCGPGACLPPPVTCCFADGGCLLLQPGDCGAAGGHSGGGADCVDAPCQMAEACCLSGGGCVDVAPAFCSGAPKGPGTSCGAGACAPAVEACCYPDASCAERELASCAETGGAPQGAGSSCGAVACPVELRACCLGSECQELVVADCLASGGAPAAPGVTCGAAPCAPPAMACCFGNGTCASLPAPDCTNQGGTPQSAKNCGAVFCVPADPCAGVRTGDSDCSGTVNNFDIDGFVVGVLSPPPPDQSPAPPEYLAGRTQSCWEARRCWGDVNGDGAFNNFDIDAFVSCILSPPGDGEGCNDATRGCCFGETCAELSPAGCTRAGGVPVGAGCGGICP